MAQIRVMEIKRVFDILEKLKLNSTKKIKYITHQKYQQIKKNSKNKIKPQLEHN